MLSKCVQCEFNIRQDDKFCLNCGLKEPSLKLPQLQFTNFNKTLLISIIVVLYFILFIFFLISLTISNSFDMQIFFAILIFPVILSIPIHNFIVEKSYKNEIRKRKVYNKNNLVQKDNIVSERLFDLSQRANKLNTILNKIGDMPSQNLQEVQQKLLSAQEIITNQFVRYELQKKKIELVRLQNQMLPYVEKLESLKDYQTENGIIESENIKLKVGNYSGSL